MLSVKELASWREADRILAELLELEPVARARTLEDLELDPDVRTCVDRLLAANETVGPLDAELGVTAKGEFENSLAGEQFGPWRLEEEIGRGGMAVVYRARREGAEFEQSVALKLLPRGMSGHERFVTEQQVLARLEHPNIARMLDGGFSECGTPWLAMELVHGLRIDRYCKGLSPREIVSLFLQVVEAVSYAHRHLVIHRDLKPGNVLIDDSGRARLLDFGIARLISGEPVKASTRVMTAEFAAPEQFSGTEVSTATDVYGLGAVLHDLLLGEPPRLPDGIASRALEASVLDSDLKNILRKALRVDAHDRYSTAQALGEDLQRWLDGLPVAATAGSRRYRAGKWLQRHWLGASATALVILALAGALAAVYWQAQKTESQLEISQATTNFLVQLFEEADPVIAEGQPTTARELLSRAQDSLAGITDPSVRDPLVLAMARASYGMADYVRARDLLAEQLTSDIRNQPQETLLLYAQASHWAGDIDQAMAFLEALPEPERSSPEVRQQLGRWLSAAARYAEADAELAAALAAVQEEADPSLRVRVLAAVAMNHITQGRYEDALGAIQPAREVSRNNGLDLQQAEIEQLSGEVAEIQGRHDDALRDYVAAREIYQKIYDDDHTSMIDIAKAEAQALRNLGRDQEALARIEFAAELAQRRVGDQPLTVNVLNSLSIAREKVGDLEGAISAAREAEAVMLRSGDDAHPLRANLLANIANYYITLGDLDEAERLTLQAEEILQLSLPPDHPVFLHTQFQMARILGRKGSLEGALEIMESLYPRAMESPGPGNHLTISIMRDIGRQNLRLGRSVEALSWFQQAVNAAQEFPEDALFRTYLELGLAEALIAEGDFPNAQAAIAPHADRLGAQSENPDGQTVFAEALIASHLGDQERAKALLAQTRSLMADEPDSGQTYLPEVLNLQEKLGLSPTDL